MNNNIKVNYFDNSDNPEKKGNPMHSLGIEEKRCEQLIELSKESFKNSKTTTEAVSLVSEYCETANELVYCAMLIQANAGNLHDRHRELGKVLNGLAELIKKTQRNKEEE